MQGWKEERKQKILEMGRKGKSIEDIAAITGCDPQVVRYHLRQVILTKGENNETIKQTT